MVLKNILSLFSSGSNIPASTDEVKTCEAVKDFLFKKYAPTLMSAAKMAQNLPTDGDVQFLQFANNFLSVSPEPALHLLAWRELCQAFEAANPGAHLVIEHEKHFMNFRNPSDDYVCVTTPAGKSRGLLVPGS